ncbi:bifunctional aspartate kinase/homoserine dehydrogenase I [Aureispira anguillae]|uniref:Bifunctional aspartate kinase/homoserine dehydrogenase I n=1 Tax=Aureispira anguillae TaxID=2864201 RepID=A0A915YDL4_9BACT|nr:bifunctional aspartate kinase/homoserine dehydrogenase I [Aureispira anguillae]BDS11162.1 bifunctional aspartate kinase/homoserine dehydrogenase I [Aureispira anguillae]
MLVIKFGGSSVASSQNIKKVKVVLSQKKQPFFLVVSAFSGTTDLLQNAAKQALGGTDSYLNTLDALKNRHFLIAKELILLENQADTLIYIQKQFNQLTALCEGVFALGELTDKTLARIMSFGELFSSFIIGHYLCQEALNVEWINSLDYIKAEGNYLEGELNRTETASLIKDLDKTRNYIAPGFIASNSKGEIVLLGRGGSDYSAAIFAGNLNVNGLEIWSDVDGMLDANPKLVKSARTIKELSYKEAFELSHFGAKVLYAPTIRPVMNKGIPIQLKNTFSPEKKGTYIGNKLKQEPQNSVKGISSIAGLSLITVAGIGLAGIKGMAKKVFATLERASVNVVLITQCCSEQNICIGVVDKDKNQAVTALNEAFDSEIRKLLVDKIIAKSNYSVIALVGDNMKMKVGLSGQLFGALGQNGINIIAIAQGASERNISVVIDTKDEKKATNVLHECFFNTVSKKVHLFVAGLGNVGKQFFKIIAEQKATLLAENNLDLRLVGIANSKRMVLDELGIDWDQGGVALAQGTEVGHFSDFVEGMKKMNLRNSIFIDNTASEEVSASYLEILKESISVITCNKIACSSSYEHYKGLKDTAKKFNCFFNYETTVGAALPVIKTIQDLRLSGDKINRIQAVLSGSLNFIFNHYNSSKNTFVEIVKQAKEEGYTEPNPLIDLSGIDVMRKILILAREAGYSLEMDEVVANAFIPENCLHAQNATALFEAIEQSESHFKQLYEDASSTDSKLKVIATFEKGKAWVGLEKVQSSSPFFHLEGKDNIVSIQSRRYPTEPLVIKGAGAGAELTAAGVFADLMLIINKSIN